MSDNIGGMDLSEALRIRSVVEMPLTKKLDVVNGYIEVNGLNVKKLAPADIEGHAGKETLVNQVYLKISRPHAVQVL